MHPCTYAVQIYLLTLSSAEAVWTSEGLSAVAGFADGVGPDKALFQTKEGSDGSGGAAADKAALARSVGLRVHPWTFRADSGIGSQFSGDFTAEQVCIDEQISNLRYGSVCIYAACCDLIC
jgi:glycerophosphoryl diester phosphodiesterase